MKTENHAELPASLCFEADGHVTDVVVTCLADGEIAIIPAAAAAHVDACDACTARLGAEALLSMDASEALLAAVAREVRAPLRIVASAPVVSAPLRESAAPSSSSRRRRPLPKGAIAAALLVAVLGALPTLLGSLRDLPTVVPDFLQAVSAWAHAIEAVLRTVMHSRSGAALRWMIAAAFIGMGSLLARSMTRKQALEGGLR